MKFQTERVDLDGGEFGMTSKDEPLWVLIPKGVKEGFVKHVTDAGNRAGGDKDGRHANFEILRSVIDWNFDDDSGEKLPLIKDLAGPEETLASLEGDPERYRVAVHTLSNTPAAFFVWLAKRLINRDKPFTEGVQGN